MRQQAKPPDGSDIGTLRGVRSPLWRAVMGGLCAERLFDGDRMRRISPCARYGTCGLSGPASMLVFGDARYGAASSWCVDPRLWPVSGDASATYLPPQRYGPNELTVWPESTADPRTPWLWGTDTWTAPMQLPPLGSDAV
jgi:hypothetical protein